MHPVAPSHPHFLFLCYYCCCLPAPGLGRSPLKGNEWWSSSHPPVNATCSSCLCRIEHVVRGRVGSRRARLISCAARRPFCSAVSATPVYGRIQAMSRGIRSDPDVATGSDRCLKATLSEPYVPLTSLQCQRLFEMSLTQAHGVQHTLPMKSSVCQ